MDGFRRWLDETGLTDDQIAAELGVSNSTISRLRSGHRRPSFALIERLILLSAERRTRGEAGHLLTGDDFFNAAALIGSLGGSREPE